MSADSDSIHDDMKHRFFSIGFPIYAPVIINIVWDGSLSHPLGKIATIYLWTGDLKRYESVLLHADDGVQTPIKIRLKSYKTGEIVDSLRIPNPTTLSTLRLTCDILKSQVLEHGLFVQTSVMNIDIQAQTLMQGGHYNLVIRGVNNSVEENNQAQHLIASFVCINPSQDMDFVQQPLAPHKIIISDEQKNQLVEKLDSMYSHLFLQSVDKRRLALNIDCDQNLTINERVNMLSNHLKTGYKKFINSLDDNIIQALCETESTLELHRLLSDRGSDKLYQLADNVCPEILKNPSDEQLKQCVIQFYEDAESEFLETTCKLQ